jgi:hypothetical protein
MPYAPSTNAVTRLVFGLLCLCLGLMQAATAAPKGREIWKTPDEFVLLAPQDAMEDERPQLNDHPIVLDPGRLAAALTRLRVHEAKDPSEAVAVFEPDAARRLATALSDAFGRAAADQDVLFAIDMAQKAAMFGSNPVSVAGRAFYQGRHLHLIIGELHISTVPPEYKNYPIGYPKIDRRLHPHQTGGRAKETRFDPAAHFETNDDVHLFVQRGQERADWLVLDVDALAGARKQAPSVSTAMPAPTAGDPEPSSGDTVKPAGSASIEERLIRLKRLRDQDLISDEEYRRIRNEILNQL